MLFRSIRFHDAEEYQSGYEDLMKLVDRHGGRDQVVIYVEKPRGMKKLPAGQGIRAGEETLEELKTRFGSENVTVR